MKYGLITKKDSEWLEAMLLLSYRYPIEHKIKVLEIGICDGDTSRGIKYFLDAMNIPFEYYGIDSEANRKIEIPFEGANVIIGKSEEVYNQLPNDFDVIFIDGCHCVNHTILDFTHYSNKVVFGGYIIFHDADPLCQGLDRQLHGPDNSDFCIAVEKGLNLLKLDKRADWMRISIPRYLQDGEKGGVAIYRRII